LVLKNLIAKRMFVKYQTVSRSPLAPLKKGGLGDIKICDTSLATFNTSSKKIDIKRGVLT